MPRHRSSTAVLALAALVAAAAALVPAGAGARGSAHSVVLRDIAFNPSRLTIPRGDRVTWKWRDRDVRHTVTSRSFRGAGARSTGSYTVTFRTEGTYRYHCALHPGMTGRIVVR